MERPREMLRDVKDAGDAIFRNFPLRTRGEITFRFFTSPYVPHVPETRARRKVRRVI
jgi:hypothetical protein